LLRWYYPGGITPGFESNAFVGPGTRIVRIKPDGLIISLDGFIVLALFTETNAFIKPIF